MTHLPGHLASGSAAGFRALGHQAALHDYLGFRDEALWKLANRARLRFPVISSLLRAGRCRDLERAVRRYKPDLLLVINGEMYDRRVIHRVSALGVRTVLWAADDPFQRSKPLVASPAYDRVYVFDPWYLPALRGYGVRRAEYLPMACDPSLHRPSDPREEDRRALAGGICFVGTWYPNREKVLCRLTDFPLQIWGGGWPLALARPTHALRPFFRGRAFGDEVVRIYRSHRSSEHPASAIPGSAEHADVRSSGLRFAHAHAVDIELLDFPRRSKRSSLIAASMTCGKIALSDHPEETARIGAAGCRRASEHTARRCGAFSGGGMSAAPDPVRGPSLTCAWDRFVAHAGRRSSRQDWARMYAAWSHPILIGSDGSRAGLIVARRVGPWTVVTLHGDRSGATMQRSGSCWSNCGDSPRAQAPSS
jgi:hypothetical protein